jgi:hypothetical protein
VSWQEDGSVDVRRNKDGTPAWHQVRFPNARYLDVNGDSIFDVFVDFRQDRTGQVFILLEDRFVAVKGDSRGLGETTRGAESEDGTKHVFEGDKWRVKQ